MKHSLFRFAGWLLFCCVFMNAFPAQQIGMPPPAHTSISGTVRDAATHQALARVVVTIEAVDSGYAGQAETDSSGRFSLQGVGNGQVVVRVRFPGYDEQSQDVNLTTNPLAYLDFELRPKK